MYAIIGAMDEEIAFVRSRLQKVTQKSLHSFIFYEGIYAHHSVVLVKSGIGKVMAAILVTLLHQHYSLKGIINIGTAGGLAKHLTPLDIVVAQKIAYHDVDVRGFASNYHYGQLAGGFPLYFQADSKFLETLQPLIKGKGFYQGLLLSGDSFVADAKIMDQIIQHYFNEEDVLAVDMESGSIAQTCYVFQIPWVIIRSISDLVGANQQHLTFAEYVSKSSERAGELLLQFLHKLI